MFMLKQIELSQSTSGFYCDALFPAVVQQLLSKENSMLPSRGLNKK